MTLFMSRLLSFVFVSLMVAGLFAGPAAANDRTTCDRASGDTAIAACTRVINSGSMKGTALAGIYRARGFLLNNQGDYDRAAEDLTRAIELDPRNAVARNNRGFAYNGKQEYDLAIADLNEALRIDPNYVIAYNTRGFVYNNMGEYDRAIADLTEAIRRDANYAIAYNNRGWSYERKKDYERSLKDYNESLRLDPLYLIAYSNRARLHESRGDLDKALADYRSILRRDQKHQEATTGVARINEKIAARTGTQPGPAVSTTVTTQTLTTTSTPTVITAGPSGPRVALVIGNGDYRHASRLANPANDARDMAQALRNLGFDVIEGRDLDRRGMEEKIREFGRKLDRSALALFFYAGHGMQVGGKNYLVPTDARLERPGDLNLDTIDVANVLAQMEAEKRVNLVFLDACRDNPLARSFARSLGTRSTSVGQGLASIQSAIGTMIAYATQPDAVAFDGDGRNSPFTTALLKHLATPGLEIATVMRRVRADVITHTREKQVPWDHSSLVGEVVLAR